MILGKDPLSTDIVLGADGTEIVFENLETTPRICRKEEHQFKVGVQERATLKKETSAKTVPRKSGGKGWNPNSGRGGYPNHIGK